jgi:ATP-binding cassette subfamily B multidrug efflux pump
MKHLARLLPLMKKYRSGIAMGLLFVLLSNILSTFNPWLLGQTIDIIAARIGESYYMPLIGFFLLIVALEGVCRFFMRRVLISISRHLEYDLRNALYAKVQKFSASVFGRVRTGEIMSRATNDLGNVRMVLGPGIMYSFTSFTMLIFVISVMFSISPTLTLIGLFPLPIMTIVIAMISRLLHQRTLRAQKSLASVTTAVQENISGIRVVKAHCREDGELESFMKKSDDLREANLSVARIFAAFAPWMMAVAGISTVIILYFGGLQVGAGNITMGQFVAFFVYQGLLIWPMTSLGWVINLFQRGSASMKLINEMMDQKSDIEEPEQAVELPKISGNISFKNVSFSYNAEDAEILSDINFEIKAGQTIAIVGKTGSGKSTLLRLIPRLYDVTGGELLVEGCDVRQLGLKQLRGAIGYVPQETFLFSDTLANNIAFGAHGEDISEERIKRAAETSKLSSDIEQLKDGYDTLLGERGINISGGQKQRAAIARALAGDPQILLLDDCLSAVDTNTEKEILSGLRQELQGRTAIIVSHRISSIMNADYILVLEDSIISAQGTHEQLLERGGLYADLWQKQRLSEELELANISTDGMDAHGR